MTNNPANSRSVLRRAVAVLMLLAFVSTLTIGAFHSHTDCVKPDSCTLCQFHFSAAVPISGSSTESNLVHVPIRHSIIDGVGRIPEPFHTSVFSGHAPPAVG